MQKTIIAIKRFLKNKNTVTVIGLVLSMAILYLVYDYRIKAATAPVSVPYAVRDIAPGELITKDMVSVKNVPGLIVDKTTLMSINDIVGKYASNKVVIPQDSIFYDSTVLEWEELPSSLYEGIDANKTLVALEVDVNSTYGNSIFPGNYIDLYFQGYTSAQDGNKLMIGKFIESIEVLAVTTANGSNVFENIGNPEQPKYIIFSVEEEFHLLLRKANLLGETIFPVPRNAEYSKNPKETRIVNTYIQRHILEKTVNVEAKDEQNKIQINGGSATVIGGNTNNELR